MNPVPDTIVVRQNGRWNVLYILGHAVSKHRRGSYAGTQNLESSIHTWEKSLNDYFRARTELTVKQCDAAVAANEKKA